MYGITDGVLHVVPLTYFLEASEQESIYARYLVGADGGHSWTRDQVGLTVEGGKRKAHFGVVDIVPITDFRTYSMQSSFPTDLLTLVPADIRLSCSIHSSKAGSMMTFPREDRLVRFYVQLAETGSEEDDFESGAVSPERITAKAAEILSPYKLTYEHCDWWSVYTVGQQCAPSFVRDNRVFLVGDAVHTHSPTMGAGMNVSLQDSFNLGWKLGQVITGVAKPDILSTYNDERRPVAKRLIDLDREMCDFYQQSAGSDARNYDEFYEHFRTFLSGVSVEYGPNLLVDLAMNEPPAKSGNTCVKSEADLPPPSSKCFLAPGIHLGQRIPSYLVLNHAEGNIVHTHSLLKADGRWRVLILAGDISQTAQISRLEKLCNALDTLCRSYVFDHTRTDSIIRVLTIHTASRDKVELLDLPALVRPFDPKFGYDYWSCFVNNNGGSDGNFDDAYERWGVDKRSGCVVVVRPDQHVSLICGLEDVDQLHVFFRSALLIRQNADDTKLGSHATSTHPQACE
jgi:phenol 2-monooxygenase (NADPH)